MTTAGDEDRSRDEHIAQGSDQPIPKAETDAAEIAEREAELIRLFQEDALSAAPDLPEPEATTSRAEDQAIDQLVSDLLDSTTLPPSPTPADELDDETLAEEVFVPPISPQPTSPPAEPVQPTEPTPSIQRPWWRRLILWVIEAVVAILRRRRSR
ncbi:MAG: hypothetical protein Kow0047_21300 [Anaerolineae bacterium]